MTVTTKSESASLDGARKDLRAILERIESLRLTDRAPRLLRARARLRPIRISRPRCRYLWILAILAWFLARYVARQVDAYRDDKCLVRLPAVTQQIFRPAEDCSICHGLDEIDKLSNVDPTLFEERCPIYSTAPFPVISYAYSGRPAVIVDAMKNWTAPTVFSYAFFKSLYDGQDANCQFFPYKTEFRNLQEVFSMSTSRALMEEGSKPWYVGWSNCDERIGTTLRQNYQRPYFLPITAESEKTDWIFMGSHGYGAPMHVDDVKRPSWQAQIKGEKLWILEPPRECHYTCKRLEVTVHAGEIIVLDTNRWYHQTMIVSEEMSITIGAEYD